MCLFIDRVGLMESHSILSFLGFSSSTLLYIQGFEGAGSTSWGKLEGGGHDWGTFLAGPLTASAAMWAIFFIISSDSSSGE